MHFKTISAIALSVATFAAANTALAYQTFFGEDLNSSSSVPLAAFPNATAAADAFLNELTGVGTEDFESFSTGQSAPLTLSFPGASGTLSATLSGGNGSIDTAAAGATNGNGRYGTSATNFWEVTAGGAGNFFVTFGSDVAAFGFFGIDIGDFGGQLQLSLDSGASIFTVPNTIGSGGSTDGSVLFFGVVADNVSEEFGRVDFLTTTGSGDVFAFDDLTIGEAEQVIVINNPVPVPASMALFALGLAGLMRARKA